MRAFVRAAAIAVTASLVAGPLAAQAPAFSNTGQSTSGGFDNFWFVGYCPVTSDGSTCASTPTFTNASVIQPGSLPSPPWYPNQPDAQWIGANPTATLPASNGTGTVAYRYVFGTVFSSSDPTFKFAFNSDNFFRGWTILPGQDGQFVSMSDPNLLQSLFNDTNWNDATPAGLSGFCRNPDGAFGPPCPALSPEITATGVSTDPANPNIMLFKLDGDGQTDGLFVTSTPEPSSLALFGTGLFGLIPMVRRRR